MCTSDNIYGENEYLCGLGCIYKKSLQNNHIQHHSDFHIQCTKIHGFIKRQTQTQDSADIDTITSTNVQVHFLKPKQRETEVLCITKSSLYLFSHIHTMPHEVTLEKDESLRLILRHVFLESHLPFPARTDTPGPNNLLPNPASPHISLPLQADESKLRSQCIPTQKN